MGEVPLNESSSPPLSSIRRVESCWILLFYAALMLYCAAVIISLRHYVPIWDGWAFYRECFMNAARTGDCSCFGHIAYFPTALYGAVAYFFPYNFTVHAFVNLFLGIAACYRLGRSLSSLFGERLWLSHAACSILMLNPVMFAQAIQPNLDYLLAVLTAFLLAAVLSSDLVTATLIGLLMTSTKEPGIMIYGVLISAYLLVTLLGILRAGDIRTVTNYAAKHVYLGLPLIGFVLYSLVLGLHGESFGRGRLSLTDVIAKVFVLFPNSDLLIAQLASLFVLNFSWLLTIGLISGVAASIWRRDSLDPTARSWLAITSIALVVGCFIHTRVLLWNNARYVLPLFVLLLVANVIGFSQLHKRRPRLAMVGLLVIISFFIASQHFTIDPVSKLAFRTFSFGKQEMLLMGGFRRLPRHGRYFYLGRDQEVYNLQFIKFSDLAEAAVREFGLDANYVTGPVFTGWTDFQNYDEGSTTRSMHPSARHVDFRPINQTGVEYQSGGHRGGFVFLALPNVLNDEAVKQLTARYELRRKRIVSLSGYSIEAYEFGEPKSSAASPSGGTMQSENVPK